MTDWDDELWRALNPGASAARGALYGTLAGLTIWALTIWTIVAVIS